MKNIICLVGESAAGKGMVVSLLSEFGYRAVSLSDEVRRLASEVGMVNPTREDLQLLAIEARKVGGVDIFAQGTVNKEVFIHAPHLVIDGIRHPSEIALIRSKAESSARILVCAVIADAETRYLRVLDRKKDSDPSTLEQFQKNDARERGENGSEFSQQNIVCIQMADVELKNNGTVHELREQIMCLLYSRGFHPEGFPIHREKE